MGYTNSNKGWEIDLLPINESTKSGDCILLRFGDLYAGMQRQDVFVIDGGYSKTAESIREHIKEYYNCYYGGKYHITGAVLTHPDLDHISGLVTLFEYEDVEVGNLIVNTPWYRPYMSYVYDGRKTQYSVEKELKESFPQLARLVELAQERGVKIYYAVDNVGNNLECGDAKFTILGPTNKFYQTCIANCDKSPQKSERVPDMPNIQVHSTGNEEWYIRGFMEWPQNDSTSHVNESSIVFMFEYKDIKILFTGDSGRLGLQHAIDNAKDKNIDLKQVDIIKMPHHGSRHNVDPEIMKRLGKYGTSCYISCTKGDEGHHPSKRLVNMLNEKVFNVYKTAGSILHRSYNAPDRGWKTVEPHASYSTIEEIEKQ